MLLVGVPVDPLIVQNSVGENSGSLIGPLGTNGVRIVDGDWSIPKLRRYNWKKTQKKQREDQIIKCKSKQSIFPRLFFFYFFYLPEFVHQC